MSQGTPTREGRIERHLMRQRGAGVRTITADFGFSFALPVIAAPAPPPVPIQLPVEPPAKRRKTDEDLSPQRCSKHHIADAKPHSTPEKQKLEPAGSQSIVGKTVEKSEPPTTQSTATKDIAKKPTRARRKLQLDEDLEDRSQKKGKVASQNASVEDTFIFGLKPTKRLPKRQKEKALLEEDPPELALAHNSTAPIRRKRTHRTKQEVVSGPVAQTGAPITCGEAAASPKAARTKADSKKALDVVAASNTEQASQSNGANSTSTEPLLGNAKATDVAKPRKTAKAKQAATEKPKISLAPVELDAEGDTAATEPVATGDLPRGLESKSAAIEASNRSTEQITRDTEKDVAITAESAVVVKSTKVAKVKPAAKKASKRSFEQFSAEVGDDIVGTAAPASKRPRRQAAVNATQKMILNYEEEFVPTDKLRRAPDTVGKRGRRTKVAIDEGPTPLPLPPPPSGSESIPEMSPREDREDDVPLQATRIKRGRKAATAAPVNNVPTPELDDASKNSQSTDVQIKPGTDKSRDRSATSIKRKAAVLDMASSSDASQDKDHKPKEEILAAPQVRKSRKAINESEEINRADVEEKPAATSPPTSTDPNYPAIEQANKGRKATTQKRSTKARRALAESDVNVVRPSPMKAADKNTKCESRLVESKETRDRAMKRPANKQEVTKRSRKIQPAELPISTPEVEPAPSKPSTSKKRHVIACEEDLDWLDEKAETKRSRPTASRHAISKSRRGEMDHDAKDIDLDALLESIAGFSGKLLTGKRGRAVAS